MQISCAVTGQLISAFVFCFRHSAVPILSKSEISSLQPSSVTVAPGLCLTWLVLKKVSDQPWHSPSLSCLHVAFTGQLRTNSYEQLFLRLISLVLRKPASAKYSNFSWLQKWYFSVEKKKKDIFFFCSKHRSWAHTRTNSRLNEAVLTNTHDLCVGAKRKRKKCIPG